MAPRVAIVGAGLSGLVAARELERAGCRVRLFDKARGPGGRMATRRREVYAFDIGAQYFTVRDARVGALLEGWRTAGVVAAWTPRMAVLTEAGPRPSPDEEARWVGTPRMSALTRYLATGLDVQVGTRIRSIERESEGWSLAAEEPLGRFDAVLVTTPPEQAVPLLAGVPSFRQAASQVVSEPCWAAMLAFARPVKVPFDAAFVRHGPLAWVARDASKPGRGPHETWVLHAGPVWSREHLEAEPERVVTDLAAAFAAAARCDLPEWTHADAHRWALATAATPRAAGALWDGLSRVGVAGDWCAGLRVEGAVLSGLEVGARMAADLAG